MIAAGIALAMVVLGLFIVFSHGTRNPAPGSDPVTAASTNPATTAGQREAGQTVPLPAIGSLVGADGKWELPPGAPPLAIAPFDETKAKEHQAAWAKHLGVPVEMTNSIGMKLVLIPPGEFMMGSPKEVIDEETPPDPKDFWGYGGYLPGEGPRHRLRITKPFWLGVTVVTQEEYQRIMGSNPSEFSATGKAKDKVGQDTSQFPVENLPSDEASEFCRKLSELPGEKAAKRRYQLPTEAQWEYACRAGNPGRRYFSVQPNPSPGAAEEALMGQYAWFRTNSGLQTHPVARKLPNAWGLYDMYGNVFQYCADHYDAGYYANSPKDDPPGPMAATNHAIRGGGWAYEACYCRSAVRCGGPPWGWTSNVGFRACLVPAEK